MGEVIRLNINDQAHDLQEKVFRGQRVVTFRDIDELHQRPDGTAARTFRDHKERLVEDVDYFRRNTLEAKEEFGVIAPNGLVLLAESGYLMVVKPFTDDLAWAVQRELVNAYFRRPQQAQTTGDMLVMMAQAYREQERRLSAVETWKQTAELAHTKQSQQLSALGHRVDNLDLTDIQGTPRQRLVAMVKLYAFRQGIEYAEAWKHFDRAYNTAYDANLTALRRNYQEKRGLRNEVGRPDYLEKTGKLEDGIRVMDKLLNASGL